MKNHCLLFLSLFPFLTHAQTNLRAWYAHGQVWIIWETGVPYPQTYGIYKSDQPFDLASEATIIGRSFTYEYLPGTFIVQTGNTAFTYSIPKPDGSIYTLAPNEALFVETVEANTSSYYGVAAWGNTTFTSGINQTINAVQSIYDPINDPVTCHLQWTETLPSGHKANWYSMWLLGKQNQNAGRDDFPVMANGFKNGMPAMFIVSEAINMDTSAGKLIPATHWLHGGGGVASGTIANQFPAFNIAPVIGISVSHNDDFYHLIRVDTTIVGSSSRTAWFGWTKAHNPFNPDFQAGPGDTIINYTQRRIMWTNNWVINHYRVDRNRVALQGYSMGSGGVSALAKTFPNQFSTVCAFNNGFRRVFEETIVAIQGTVEDNLPTNLRRGNTYMHINEVFDMNTPLSNARDLPLFRTWAGKNDLNDRMHWGPDLVTQYRMADSLGWGMQISWDERPHTYDSLNYHWIYGVLPLIQTYRDNLPYQELFNSKQSFPAFFNHSKDQQNNDPGTGIQGINLGDGDNWGTWGGYHNWDLQRVTDEPETWEVIAWLTTNAPFQNDICPTNSLTADVAIRKPQQFKPGHGIQLEYTVKDDDTNELLQSGTITTGADSLVVIPQVNIYSQSLHKVRISVTYSSTATENVENNIDKSDFLKVVPNPSHKDAYLLLNSDHAETAEIIIMNSAGQIKRFRTNLIEGSNKLSLEAGVDLPPGLYFVTVYTNFIVATSRWVKY